jgi:hypothetical protein
MNARFRSGFIAVLHRIPGFQKFCGWRIRGTNNNYNNTSRYPNGESICLALNHQTYINKINKKSDCIDKNDDYLNEDINGTDNQTNKISIFCLFLYFAFISNKHIDCLYLFINYSFLKYCPLSELIFPL